MKRVILSVCLMGATSALFAGEAMQLLNKMSVAVHELDYQGDLVYSQGDGFSMLRIQHSNVDGTRISNLDGEGRTHSQEGHDFSLANFPQIRPEMENVYSFDIGGVANIAGRSCTEVVARPKDRMRYLQRYCIDQDNNMLLNYSLVDTNRKTVEKMMFTQIKFDKQNIKEYVKDKVSKIKKKIKPFNLIKKQENKTTWEFSQLPKGFHVDSVLMRDESNNSAPLEQIILTDNVTSISLFIESESEPPVNREIMDYRGALNGLTIEKDDHIITAIGEVPRSTLLQIVDGLRYRDR